MNLFELTKDLTPGQWDALLMEWSSKKHRGYIFSAIGEQGFKGISHGGDVFLIEQCFSEINSRNLLPIKK